MPNEPLYPFGYGLSYTTFTYEDLRVPPVVSGGEDVVVTVTVNNTGDRAGDEVVIAYLHDEYASVTRPVKEVAAFQRLHLEAGESKTIHLTIKPEQLALYNREMKRVVEPGAFTLYVGEQKTTFEKT
jgi:beta-glucosidase